MMLSSSSPVQSSNVASLAGKDVVHDEVGPAEQAPDGRPPQVEAREGGARAAGEVGGDAHGIELSGHAGEDCKPHEGVPGPLVLEALLPGQHT